jgi:hypothetical protein
MVKGGGSRVEVSRWYGSVKTESRAESGKAGG